MRRIKSSDNNPENSPPPGAGSVEPSSAGSHGSAFNGTTGAEPLAANLPEDVELPDSRPEFAFAAVILILLLTVPVFYIYVARMAINCDPFVYGQNAKDMLQGKRLYSEIWE